MVTADQVKKARSIIEKTIWNELKIFNAASDKGLVINRNTSGSYKMDKILGNSFSWEGNLWSWLPEGRIIEIFWAESSWKTTTTTIMAASYTKDKKYVMFIDVEQAYDLEYAKKIWIDPEYFDIVQPNSWEEAFLVVQWAIESWVYDLIIIDSVSALTPKAVLENTADDVQKIWILATLMAQNIPRMSLALAKRKKATVIFINQVRAKISTGFSGWYGPQTTTTWGKTLNFYASIRLEIKKWMPIKRWDEIIWNEMKIKTVKNKTFPPMKTTVINLMFDEKWNRWWTDAWSEIFDEIVLLDLIWKSWRYISLDWKVAIRKEKIANMEEVEYIKKYLDWETKDELERERLKNDLTSLKGVDFLKIYLKQNPKEFAFLEKKIRSWETLPLVRNDKEAVVEFVKNNKLKK